MNEQGPGRLTSRQSRETPNPFRLWFRVFADDVVVLAATQPPSTASLFGGRLCLRWPRGSMNASAEVLPSPPHHQFSGETGTTSFRKKEKKKFLEFQAPWNYFVRQGLSSEALRFQGGLERAQSLQFCLCLRIICRVLGLHILGGLPRV